MTMQHEPQIAQMSADEDAVKPRLEFVRLHRASSVEHQSSFFPSSEICVICGFPMNRFH
jgi:hypothetical protein